MGKKAPLNATGGSDGIKFAVRQIMKKNEDRYIAEPDLSSHNLPEDEHILSFFCVLDGHSNQKCSTYCEKILLPNIVSYVKGGRQLNDALVLAFEKTDSDFGRSPFACFAPKSGGSTCCSFFLRGKNKWTGEYELVISNVGDSRALLVPLGHHPGTEWKQLSTDHTPHHHKESKRVQIAGGRIAKETRKGMDVGPLRVYPGGVAVTRAIGDKDCSDSIIATPEVTFCLVPPGGGRIVVASDGLWGALSNEKVVQLCLPQKEGEGMTDPEEACTDLMRAVIKERGVHDDITIICIDVIPQVLDSMMREWPPAGRGNADPRRVATKTGSVITVIDELMLTNPSATTSPDVSFKEDPDDVTVHRGGAGLLASSIPGFGGAIGMRPILEEIPSRKRGRGTVLTKSWELKALVGRGQYGSVRIANELNEPYREVVVKSMATSSERRQYLCNEVDTMIAVAGKHDRVPQVFATYEESGALHIVMEKIHGKNLLAHVSTGKSFTEVDASDIMYQVLDGIAFLHSMNVAHRDIKPDNIMVVTSSIPGAQTGVLRKIKIVDFGSACFAYSGDVLTDWVGTKFYSGPEVRAHRYGTEADVWAAGAMLYVLISGMPEHTATRRVYEALLKGQPINLPEGLSLDLIDLLHKLLQPDPKQRLTAEQALEHPWLSVRTGRPNRQPLPLDSSINGAGLFTAVATYEKQVRVLLSAMLTSEEIGQLTDMLGGAIKQRVTPTPSLDLIAADVPQAKRRPEGDASPSHVAVLSRDLNELVAKFVGALQLEAAVETLGKLDVKEKLLLIRIEQVAGGAQAEMLGVRGRTLQQLNAFGEVQKTLHSALFRQSVSVSHGARPHKSFSKKVGSSKEVTKPMAPMQWYLEGHAEEGGHFSSVHGGGGYFSSTMDMGMDVEFASSA